MGDPLYGKPKRAAQMPDRYSRDALSALRSFPRQALHAASLSFAHPVSGVQMDLTSPLPSDMTELMARIDAAIAARARG